MVTNENSPRFAEHSYAAPEAVVYDRQAPEPTAPATHVTDVSVHAYNKQDYSHPYYAYAPQQQVDPEEPGPGPRPRPKKRICGVSPLLVWVLGVLLVVIIVCAVAVPVSIVTKNDKKDSSSPSTTSTPTTSSPTSSSTPTPTALQMISANWGGADVTDAARTAFQKDNGFVIQMDQTPLTDTWNGVQKCLSILHNFGSSIRTFVACDGDGEITLSPGPLSLSEKTQEITRQGPTTRNFAIVSVVWGTEEIRDQKVYDKIAQCKTDGTAITLDNTFFGKDNWLNTQKSAVVWYTEDNFTTFKSIYGREADTVTFPV